MPTSSTDEALSAATTTRRPRLRSSTAQTRRRNTARSTRSSSVWLLRILFLSFLLVLITATGILIPRFLDTYQRELAEEQYQAIAERALQQAATATRIRLAALHTLAAMVGQLVPTAEAYPFVVVPGFERLARLTLTTIAGARLAFCPLIRSSDQAAWEDFAYDYYDSQNVTVVNSFGKGIWGVDPSLNTSDNRYHHTDGKHSNEERHEDEEHFHSDFDVLAPVFQFVGPPGVRPFLFNLRSRNAAIEALENMLSCVVDQQHATTTERRLQDRTDDDDSGCSVITAFTPSLVDSQQDQGPSASIFVPILPLENQTQVTAFLSAPITWVDILRDAFADSVSGVQCVLKAQNRSFTYTITDGVVQATGLGDSHQPKYDNWNHSVVLNNHDNGSPLYELFLYPTDELYDVYRAVQPALYAFGAIAIVVFTSLLFVVYDFCVCRDLSANRELMESKRQFVRYISHEVRTPLNSVCIGLSLLQEKIAVEAGFNDASSLEIAIKDPSTDRNYENVKESTAEMFKFTEELIANSQCSVDVLNDFLQYDKIEAGTLDLNILHFDLLLLIRQTTNEFRLQTSTKDLEFHLVLADKTGDYDYDAEFASSQFLRDEAKVVLGDDVRMRQVLRNLISNAIKFTPEGGKINVVARWHGSPDGTSATDFVRGSETADSLRKALDRDDCHHLGSLTLEISDTGVGMTQNQIGRLFRDGTQFNVNELQQGQGTGLGLFITKGIVEKHSGTIFASSEGLGKGSTFTVKLPLFSCDDRSQTGIAESDHEHPSPTQQRQKKTPSRKILVVDDSVSSRKMMSRLLEHHGHPCHTCESGEEALQLVVEASEGGEPFDTILLDFELPVLSGPETSQRLCELDGIDPYIVGITGNVFPEDVALFLNSGAKAVLPKPFRMTELQELWANRQTK